MCLLASSGAFAQTTDDLLTFEVASVKPAPPGREVGSSFKGGPGTSEPGRITVINRTLRTLIIEAYGIHGYQIEHPAWVGESRYDIVANVPSGATAQQAKVMMRNLLVDRFDLSVRREMRDLPIYALVIAKGGVKMKPSADDTAPAVTPFDLDKLKAGSDGFPQLPRGAQNILNSYMEGEAKAVGQRQSMSKIVSWLTGIINDRPIVDQTGLQGNYDFSMTWSPDPGVVGNFFSAIQRQLGLALEPRKTPAEMLIFVSALKAPKEN